MNALERRRQALAESGMVTPREAARILACSVRRVSQLREAGVLSYALKGKHFVYPRAACVEYAAKNIRLGSVA